MVQADTIASTKQTITKLKQSMYNGSSTSGQPKNITAMKT